MRNALHTAARGEARTLLSLLHNTRGGKEKKKKKKKKKEKRKKKIEKESAKIISESTLFFRDRKHDPLTIQKN